MRSCKLSDLLAVVDGDSKFFRFAFALEYCWITVLKSEFLARSFSKDSRDKPLNLLWDMELRRKFFISLSFEKYFSVASVTGTVRYIMYAVQTSG